MKNKTNEKSIEQKQSPVAENKKENKDSKKTLDHSMPTSKADKENSDPTYPNEIYNETLPPETRLV